MLDLQARTESPVVCLIGFDQESTCEGGAKCRAAHTDRQLTPNADPYPSQFIYFYLKYIYTSPLYSFYPKLTSVQHSAASSFPFDYESKEPVPQLIGDKLYKPSCLIYFEKMFFP